MECTPGIQVFSSCWPSADGCIASTGRSSASVLASFAVASAAEGTPGVMRVGLPLEAVSHKRTMACPEDAVELMRLFGANLHTVGIQARDASGSIVLGCYHPCT